MGQDEFMRWQDPDHHVASYVGVMTGWGATGEWEVCAAGWGGGGDPAPPLPPGSLSGVHGLAIRD